MMKKLFRQRAHKAALAARIANEVRRSGVEPGRIAWIAVDSDGTVHVSP